MPPSVKARKPQRKSRHKPACIFFWWTSIVRSKLNMLCLIIFFKHLSAKAAWIKHHELRVRECQWKPNVWSYREEHYPKAVWDFDLKASQQSFRRRSTLTLWKEDVPENPEFVESIKLPFGAKVPICSCSILFQWNKKRVNFHVHGSPGSQVPRGCTAPECRRVQLTQVAQVVARLH